MLKKQMKRVVVDPSLAYAVDEEARMRFKYQSLTQDYEELQKEADATKKKLEKSKKKRQTLLAEVRFLRRRYKYLVKNQSPNHPPGQDLAEDHDLEIQNDILARDRSYSGKEADMQKPAPVLDLNQISRGEDEEEEFQVNLEPLRMETKPKNYLMNSLRDEQLNDVKLSVCRDIENGSNRTGKRKISWQDQVALRV